jgi:hypothetical protein
LGLIIVVGHWLLMATTEWMMLLLFPIFCWTGRLNGLCCYYHSSFYHHVVTYHVLFLPIWRCFTIGFRFFLLHPSSTNELCALFQESFRMLHPWRAKDVTCVVPVSLSLLRAWSS